MPGLRALLPFNVERTDILGVDGPSIASGLLVLGRQRCSNTDCGVVILHYQHTTAMNLPGVYPEDQWRLLYPEGIGRPPPDAAVPADLAQDREACLVLSKSPKASAALARRCLQVCLRGIVGKKRNLEDEIDAAADQLPSDLVSDLHALRQIGNFAAHPTKDTETGLIVDVEAGEAEWTLDLVHALFDHVYVAPKRREERREALSAKLDAARKPPLR